MAGRIHQPTPFGAVLAAVCWLALAALPASGQPPAAPELLPPPSPSPPAPSPAPPGPSDGGFSDADSKVGYIDNAIPRTQLRLRYDTSRYNRQPSRAEFVWAKAGPGNPGVPLPEPLVDQQEFLTYAEAAFCPSFSAFVETPVRFLNPEVNANTAGLGDMNAGIKWAFLETQDLIASFQLRTYAPTGAGHRGLGTRHASLEPALLFWNRLSDQLTCEGELRLWVPVGGTDFAGEVVRYGVGFSYGQRSAEDFWLTPVVEVVGWTVLSGKTSVFTPPALPLVEEAAGQTIINAKLGLRMGFGNRGDLYAGYGRALTGDAWYRDVFRVEFRLLF
jgi:hypothetical protein